MRVHVLLFDAGTDSEGIHSLEIAGRTVVLLFGNPDDAERYAGLLEAQDFPVPTVEALDREDVDLFCREAGYEARLRAIERSGAAPAGSVFAYGIDVFHRGTNLTLPDAHRFTVTASYKAAGNDQIGWSAWPRFFR